ncbi:MAG: translation elongation factor Ts [Acidobacteria bacterium]|nr:translation elongation factor Ts [Acidobacteriota bacterium]
MAIKATLVKELRDRSGAGFMDCKQALEEAAGDLERATEILRQKGLAAAGRRAGRPTREGAVGSYVHAGGRIGVLVEVNCETDFVARTGEFQGLLKDLAMHVAASAPQFLRRDEVPPAVLDRERRIFQEQARSSGKPEKVWENMVQGRLEKFYAEQCLEEQPFVRDPNITVRERIQGVIQKTGENIRVSRFARFVLGDCDAGPASTPAGPPGA